ncbi:hypothetical protein [Aureivirga marina]|uniref:hypothetical protein n=1 Tax=Aureivirga marina TaxID=1182451 RepID=UPI0018C9A4AF|nr:hypothetical protein [Aureivirga marina]
MKLAILLSIGSTFEILLWILAVIIIVYILAKKKSVLNRDKNIPFDDAIVEDAPEKDKPKEDWAEDVKEEDIIEVKEENEEKKEVKSKKKTSEKSPELNFERIGKPNHENKDDLKKIKGIGPVLEKKLNEIGITNYAQILNLNKNDLQLISILTNYPFSKIQGNQWVKQVKDLEK